MRSYRRELWLETRQRREFVNITPQVEECLRESGIREGLVLCNAMHITASVFVNDDETGLHHDFEAWLDGADAVLTPSATGAAPAGLDATGDPVFCRLWTLLGLPAVSLPCHTTPEGLPVGVQLVGRLAEDDALLALAQRIEPRVAPGG